MIDPGSGVVAVFGMLIAGLTILKEFLRFIAERKDRKEQKKTDSAKQAASSTDNHVLTLRQLLLESEARERSLRERFEQSEARADKQDERADELQAQIYTLREESRRKDDRIRQLEHELSELKTRLRMHEGREENDGHQNSS